jgi:hypothetical protein
VTNKPRGERKDEMCCQDDKSRTNKAREAYHETLLVCEHEFRGIGVVCTVGFVDNKVVFLVTL